MARKQNHLNKIQAKFDAAYKLKKTRPMSSAGIKFEKSAHVQHKKVDGEICIKQPMKGKQKIYRNYKPLI